MTDARLEAAGIELVALAPERAEFRLPGRWQGRPVRWRVTLEALDHPSRRQLAVPQYIELVPAGGEEVPVRVGLRIVRVDVPAVLKTGIMLRNYRRLRPGRHEWTP